jgi:hypothetical protein
LDNKVKEFITLYVIREWFKRQKYDLSFVEPEYQIARTDLGMIINYRVAVKRPVRNF